MHLNYLLPTDTHMGQEKEIISSLLCLYTKCIIQNLLQQVESFQMPSLAFKLDSALQNDAYGQLGSYFMFSELNWNQFYKMVF